MLAADGRGWLQATDVFGSVGWCKLAKEPFTKFLAAPPLCRDLSAGIMVIRVV